MYEQRKRQQHTWKSPDKKTFNQNEYIMYKRLGIALLNVKTMSVTGCSSDYV